MKIDEQIYSIAWSRFKSLWGVGFTVVPLYRQGMIAGSEFLTYTKKLYFALEMGISQLAPQGTSATPCVTLYNESNVASFIMNNGSICYDSAGVEFDILPNTYFLHNVYFSRIVVTNTYSHLVFNGYKVTWP